MISSLFPYFLQNLIWIPTQIFLRFFGHFEIYGKNNLCGIKGAVIFASNHTSELDPILLPAAMPMFSRFLPMFYVSREKNFYDSSHPLKRLFYGGLFFEFWGAYRTHVGLHNYEISLQPHLKILERGHSLSIFPEGKKGFDGIPREGKGGAAFLSHKTGAPVVPVAISGAFKTSVPDFFSFKKHFRITFGKPIYPNELFAGKKIKDPHDYKIIVNESIMPRIAEMMVK